MAEYRPTSTDPLRFGVFEIDPSARELRKHGVRINLQDQPFAVLLILLEKPGQIVTKEELQQRLWPADTFVEFDKGIYNAMKRLRETLGDHAETPRYIETLPRRGYRFVAPVTRRDGVEERFELPPSSDPIPRASGIKRLAFLASFLGLLAFAAIFVRIKLWSSPPIPKVADTAQLTNDGGAKDITLRLLSDGMRLYFQEGGAYVGPESTVAPGFAKRPALVQVSIRGGETAEIPMSFTESLVFDASPNRPELLLGGPASKTGTSFRRELWLMPLPLGRPRRVGDILALDASWSPDGNHIVFVDGKDILVANPDGSEIRKLATAPDTPYWVRFSPDGTRLRFTVFSLSARPEDWGFMEMASDGSGLHHLPIHGCCGKWSADGKYYFYQTSRDIWVLPERRNLWGRAELGAPAQLTTGPIKFGAATPSADGKQLFVIGDERRIELVRYDRKSKQLVPFLGGISAGEVEVSPDGQWVVYSTYPDSNLWRSKLDGSERLQLTFAPINAHEPRWSADGKQIVFTDVPRRLFIVSADGGRPQQIMPQGEFPDTEVGIGGWMPDGNSILFVMGSEKDPYAAYLLNLKTQEVSKFPGAEGQGGGLVSRDGQYILFRSKLYSFQTRQWADFREVARGGAESVWSHDNKSVYQCRGNGDQLEVVSISVPDGKVERVLDLKGVTLGGYWPGVVGLLPDDSPLLMLNRSKQEIYRLDLQYR
jgi:DNA-binding winged helix-turn-helix (wHTH) protein/Tol biopolymer transport system component